jgi:hypothetical protein
MKKPQGVSLEVELFERVKVAAKTKRESASKWIEDAIYERFEALGEHMNETPPSYKSRKKKRK